MTPQVIRVPFDERETWPEERWREFQWERLRSAVQLAESLPFYRERFSSAGVRAEDLKTWHDLSRFPITRKADLIAAMRASGNYRVGIEADAPKGPKALGMTTGTLGTAILEYPDEWRRVTGDAAARAYWWAGLRSGMSMLVAAPAWHSMAIRQSQVAERIAARCVIPWGTFLPRYADGFIDAMRDLRPSFVCLFLPMLYSLIAESRTRKGDVAGAFAGVRSVLVGGAPLTPLARRRLTLDLGVDDVYDSAGSSEGLLAGECWAHDGCHYFVDVCHVEVVDPKTLRPLAAGERGSIILTTLAPYGSMHVRYDTEDVGEILPGRCPCGCTWPRLRIYDRRANAMTLVGREILWYDVRACIDEIPELVGKPCAVVRPALGARTLKVFIQLPTGPTGTELESILSATIMQRLGVELEVVRTADLPSRFKGVTVVEEGDLEHRTG